MLNLTGTITGGTAADIFYLFWRLYLRMMSGMGYGWNDVERFSEDYGVVEKRFELIGDAGHWNVGSRGRQIGSPSVKPGISPRLFLKLVDKATFLDITDFSSHLPDGKITVRIFEYDAQIALDEGEVTEETLTVTFPNTAVLYLRTYKKTPDRMKYVIVTPGGTVQYDIPIMKVQNYTLDDIFEKRLLMLIPFYIFSHENRFPEYNGNEQRLEEFKAEYYNVPYKVDTTS